MDVSVTLTTLLYFVISVALMCYVYMHNFFPPKKVLFTSLVFGFLDVILMKDNKNKNIERISAHLVLILQSRIHGSKSPLLVLFI